MGRLNLELRKGATFDRLCTWWTEQDVTPRDLTGYALRLQIRDRPGGTIHADLQNGSGITIVDAPAGQFRLTIDAATTLAWTWSRAVYDLRATDPGGIVSYPLDGAIHLTLPVTVNPS